MAARCTRELPAILARRVRKTHKGTFGRACIIGGAEGLVGAALLAGRAALRLGAGRVVVGSPRAIRRSSTGARPS